MNINNKTDLTYPKLCIIELSRFCNFQCFMCPHRDMDVSSQGNMKYSTFKKIIDDTYSYTKIYQLYWMGEPFINNSIFDMVDYLRSKTDASVIVSTNGSLLSEEISQRIVNSGINKLIIDIDSGDSADIYSQIRKGGNFEQLIRDVEYLININKNNNLEIILQFLHFKMNSYQLPVFMNQWKDRNCTLRVDWIDSWANQMPNLLNEAAEISPYVNDTRTACADLWNRVTINYRGDVNLCCHDYNGTYKFGNINEKSLVEIWNSKQLCDIRSNQLNGIYSGICEHCIEWAKEIEYEEFL